MDIETSPNLGYTWAKWEQNVIEFEREWYMLTFSAKWLGEKKIITKGLPDYKLYKTNPEDDKELVKELWSLIDQAEIVIAHNGDKFDIKKMNARFAFHGLNPPTPYKSIDTLKVARRYFSFNSNKLTDLGEYFNLGKKIDTGGFQLWRDCMRGVKSSWKLMMKYNEQDVILLEKVYLKLRGWMTNSPNLNLLSEVLDSCPICGGTHLQKRGTGMTRIMKYVRYQCQSCGGWSRGGAVKIDNFEIR